MEFLFYFIKDVQQLFSVFVCFMSVIFNHTTAITGFLNYIYFYCYCVAILRQAPVLPSLYITRSISFPVGCWLVEIRILLWQTCTSIPWGIEQHVYQSTTRWIKVLKICYRKKKRGACYLTYDMIFIWKYSLNYLNSGKYKTWCLIQSVILKWHCVLTTQILLLLWAWKNNKLVWLTI